MGRAYDGFVVSLKDRKRSEDLYNLLIIQSGLIWGVVRD